ncbi:uncharacterized protein ACJ7VT_020625 [Polymixia lowei]
MHCGRTSILLLVLWVLSAEIWAFPVDRDLLSIMDNLQGALQNYTMALRHNNSLSDLAMEPCPEKPPNHQSDSVVQRLSQYQVCLELLRRSSSEEVKLTDELISLNTDVIQHLGSVQGRVVCPLGWSSRSSDSFVSLRRLIHSLDCWRLEVSALRT